MIVAVVRQKQGPVQGRRASLARPPQGLSEQHCCAAALSLPGQASSWGRRRTPEMGGAALLKSTDLLFPASPGTIQMPGARVPTLGREGGPAVLYLESPSRNSIS